MGVCRFSVPLAIVLPAAEAGFHESAILACEKNEMNLNNCTIVYAKYYGSAIPHIFVHHRIKAQNNSLYSALQKHKTKPIRSNGKTEHVKKRYTNEKKREGTKRNLKR